MTGYEQIRKGVVTYMAKELAPLAPKMLAISMMAFAPVVIDAKMKQLFESGLFSGTALMDGNSVDLEEAMRLFKSAAEGRWPISVAGFDFSENDLDKLYRYIKEA